MSRIALIDADVYAYSCGFATQKTLQGVFGDEPYVDAEPVEHALALVKGSLAKLERILKEIGYGESHYYLTGKDNFRIAVAQVAPYKGNRVQEKPVHYQAIRDYIKKKYGASVEDGWEADDAIASVSHSLGHDPASCLIVSQDKDLLTVPGILYNPRKDKIYSTSPAMALIREYRQILTGDTADNIPGCYKIGPVKAKKIIPKGLTEKEGRVRLIKAFKDSIKLPGCPYAHRPPEDVLEEMGQLVHLKRFREDVWKM